MNQLLSQSLTLTTYFRSTAAYRVRIALNHKGVDHRLLPVNLLKGEHKEAAFLAHSPQGLLPTLEVDDASLQSSRIISQSMAILEYLEEAYPDKPLLPTNSLDRAQARALAHSIACDIHPLNNLRVLKYLVSELGTSEADKIKWYHHWLHQGFSAIELQLASLAGSFCIGDTPSLADVCLVPQVYNANRFEFALCDFPLISKVNNHCLELAAFDDASPEKQTDFV